MRRVAEQRDPAVTPARQRIAVAHRIFPELAGRLDQRFRVHIGNAETPQVRHQILETARARPILLLRNRHRWIADAADDRPVGQPFVCARTLGNRVDHELGGEAAGHDHRASGEERRPVDRAAPEHQAVPARRALVGKELVADERVDTVRADQHVAARGMPVRSWRSKKYAVTPPSSWVNDCSRQLR